jgi:signal transduction histidine kinase
MVATESLAATKTLASKTDVAKELPCGLGAEQRLTQVLLYLVGNAIKSTDAGEVCIAAGAANGRFALSVSDTGPGIPPEECEHIFEKFRQVDSSNSRAKVAQGSSRYCQRDCRDARWAHLVGQVSTFHLVLPLRAADPVGAA